MHEDDDAPSGVGNTEGTLEGDSVLQRNHDVSRAQAHAFSRASTVPFVALFYVTNPHSVASWITHWCASPSQRAEARTPVVWPYCEAQAAPYLEQELLRAMEEFERG